MAQPSTSGAELFSFKAEFPIMRKFSSLAAWMRATHTTQAVLARDVGVTSAYISALVHKRKQPGLTVALKIHQRTGGQVPIAVLVRQPDAAGVGA